MANLITGIDWIDHGLIPRPEPSEPSKEKGKGQSPDTEDQDDTHPPEEMR